MGRLFDLESPVMRALGRIGDLLILNMLMIVCCIPIITAGASFTAMHYVLLKMIRDEEGYLIRGFFKSFALNFKQATLIWLLMLLVIVVYALDIIIFSRSGIVFPRALVITFFALGILMFLIAMYVFPLLARFDNTIRNTLKNAVIISFANIPKTLLMALFYAVPLILGYYSFYSYIFIFMFGITGPAYGAAWLYSKIFKKYEPQTEQTSDLDFSLNVEWGEEETNGETE